MAFRPPMKNLTPRARFPSPKEFKKKITIIFLKTPLKGGKKIFPPHNSFFPQTMALFSVFFFFG